MMLDALTAEERAELIERMRSANHALTRQLQVIRQIPRQAADTVFGPDVLTQMTATRRDIFSVLVHDLARPAGAS